MSHNISTNTHQVRHFDERSRFEVNDTFLLALVFTIGLIGLCYIMHTAVTKDRPSKTLYSSPDDAGNTESIYFTASR